MPEELRYFPFNPSDPDHKDIPLYELRDIKKETDKGTLFSSVYVPTSYTYEEASKIPMYFYVQVVIFVPEEE